MNINQLIKRIKDESGLTRYLKTSYTDHDIYKIIEEHVIKDYARYFKVEVELGQVTFTEGIGPDIFLIPDWIIKKFEECNLRIEGIKSIRFSNNTMMDRTGLGQMLGYRMDGMNLDAAFAGMSVMNRQGGSDIYQNYLNTCWFEKPNRIRFMWNSTADLPCTVTLSVWASCNPNLIGTAIGREHTLYELCKLTVQSVIYQNEGKYIENIASGIGNINLRIDEWASAGERKQELLNKMYNDSILHQQAVKIL